MHQTICQEKPRLLQAPLMYCRHHCKPPSFPHPPAPRAGGRGGGGGGGGGEGGGGAEVTVIPLLNILEAPGSGLTCWKIRSIQGAEDSCHSLIKTSFGSLQARRQLCTCSKGTPSVMRTGSTTPLFIS